MSTIRRLALLTLTLLTTLAAWAYRYESGGIYYDIVSRNGHACLSVTFADSTFASYSGDVTIPAKVVVKTSSGNHYFQVVQIGKCAFKDCRGLRSVTLPATVTAIDSCAFQGCAGLTGIGWSEAVTAIGDNAFEGCAALTEVSLPAGVTEYGKNIFKNCVALRSFGLPASTTAVPEGMFSGCAGLEDPHLAASVTAIGDNAFSGCTGLRRVQLAANVTTVGDNAFRGCGSLGHIVLGGQMRSVGHHAFADCAGIDSVTFDIGCTAIMDKNVFSGCPALKALVCKGLDMPVLSDALGLDEHQRDTVRLLVPYSNYESFRNAPGWRDFASTVRLNYDFGVQHGLEPIYYRLIGDDEVSVVSKDRLFNSYQGNYITHENIEFWTGHWGYQSWRYASIPSTVELGDRVFKVTEIADEAYKNCTSINILDISCSQIRSIGRDAFAGCSRLLFIDPNNHLTSIGARAFESCTMLQYVEYNPALTSIDTCAFRGCSSLKMISFRSAVSVAQGAFAGTSLGGHQLTGGVGIFSYSLTPPALADSTAFSAAHYPKTKVKVLASRLSSYRADEHWHRFANIMANCFDFYDNGIYYRINSDNVSVNVAPGNDVTYNSYAADNVNVPATVSFNGATYAVTGVEPKTFQLSTSSRVNLPGTVKHIGDLAFANCHIGQVNLGGAVETIGGGAFNASQISSIEIPRSVRSIGQFALLNTPQLRTIAVEDGNLRYDSREGCNALIETATNRLLAGSGSTTIPPSVAEIADSAFWLNQQLERIVIPETITRLGNMVFFSCQNLEKALLPETLTSIGVGTFFNCGLARIDIPDRVETVGGAAFLWCQKLQTVSIGKGLKKLGAEAFKLMEGHALEHVICKAATPPAMESSNCFEGVYERATLYVPKSALELYRADANWSRFFRIASFEESAIETVEEGLPAESGPRTRYDLTGRPVGDTYRGIVIEDGKKVLVK